MFAAVAFGCGGGGGQPHQISVTWKIGAARDSSALQEWIKRFDGTLNAAPKVDEPLFDSARFDALTANEVRDLEACVQRIPTVDEVMAERS